MPRQLPAAGRHTVKTNKEPASQLELNLTPVTFQRLWDNYVDIRCGSVFSSRRILN